MLNTQQNTKIIILAISMLTAITPLAIDIYLPSFPQISRDLQVPLEEVEITLSIFLFGFAIGQLIGGPLSDKYGRKKFIYFGLILFNISCLMISLSNSIEELWILRFIQAIGGGFIVVNANAIVRDLYSGKEMAKAFSIISMIMLTAPMFAPFFGVGILHYYSWNYIFIFLLLYGTLLIIFVWKLPETSPKTSGTIIKNYLHIIYNKDVLLLMIAGGLATSGMFLFITKASFIYIEYFKLKTTYFPFVFAANIITLITVGKLNIKLLYKYSPEKLFLLGVSIQLFSSIFLYSFSHFNSLIITLCCIMVYVGVLGFVFGNIKAIVLEKFKHISATASALNGVIGFAIASFIGFLASYVHNGSLEIIFLLMIIIALLALLIMFYRMIIVKYKLR